MASRSETGHGKNGANFNTLSILLKNMGEAYNPVKGSIQLKAVQAQSNATTTVLDRLRDTLAAGSKLTNERKAAFKALSPFLPRIVSAIRLADASRETVDDAMGFIAKLRGDRRDDTGDSPTDSQASNEETPGKNRHSVSQQSFDLKVEHYKNLLALIEKLPAYASNDPEISREGLQQRGRMLHDLNTLVKDADSLSMEDRLLRDKLLYMDETGVLATVTDIKNYLRTLTGGTKNPHYKAAVALKFKRRAE